MNLIKDLVTKQIELPKLESKLIGMKRDIEELTLMMKCGVLHYGESHSDDYESGCNWYLFGANMSDDKIVESLIEMGIVEDTDRGVYDDNDWDCSGKCMRYEPRFKRTKTRVLVTQSYAYDF
jgi:hypothetical protein|tara:strand:+ start:355 stop:720 length:366 start_codon:yes stop_codon:yes gene_type:complete